MLVVGIAHKPAILIIGIVEDWILATAACVAVVAAKALAMVACVAATVAGALATAACVAAVAAGALATAACVLAAAAGALAIVAGASAAAAAVAAMVAKMDWNMDNTDLHSFSLIYWQVLTSTILKINSNPNLCVIYIIK